MQHFHNAIPLSEAFSDFATRSGLEDVAIYDKMILVLQVFPVAVDRAGPHIVPVPVLPLGQQGAPGFHGNVPAVGVVQQAAIVTVLARMAKIDLTLFIGEQEDGIAAGQQFTEAAIWARRSGLLPEDGVFTGTETTTRNQMAVMLMKYLQSMGKSIAMPETPVVFADADGMSSEGANAFQVLYHNGIFRETGGLNMNPTGSTTRAHFVALIQSHLRSGDGRGVKAPGKCALIWG